MNRYLSILLLLLCLSTGCGPGSGDGGGLPVIDVVGSLGSYRQIPMSELISELEYIPLETAPKFMIANTGNVIVTDTRIFIGGGDHGYAFTREGKFVSDIGRKGRGPGEWPRFTHMSIDEDNMLVWLDTYSHLFEYTWDGKFERNFEKPMRDKGGYYEGYVDNVSYLHDSLFIGYIENDSGKEQVSWVILNREGEMVKAFDNHIKINKEPFVSSLFNSSKPAKVSELTYVQAGFNDTIYCVNPQNELVPSFVYDFGKYDFPPYAYLTVFSTQEDLHVRPLEYLRLSRDYVFFGVAVGVKSGIPIPEGNIQTVMYGNQSILADDRNVVMGLYDIAEGATELLDRDPVSRKYGLVNDFDGGLSFWPKYYTSTDELVDVWSAYEMKDLLTEEYFAAHPARDPAAHARLRELLRNLDETDNPVIVIAKLK